MAAPAQQAVRPPSARGVRTGAGQAARWRVAWLLPLLLGPVALLPDLGAALPLRTYYFRDFSLGFYPLRLFQARELLAGRLPFWNPFLHEGTFALPALYPPDLLHALAPGPAFVSWLLTLHLPLAALLAYALARELGLSRTGAFVGGSVYALGGFALSCVNLYLFLQALAWAPLVVLSLRRAALRGGRWIAGAALAVALGLSTLALELLGQALALGLLLAWTSVRGTAAGAAPPGTGRKAAPGRLAAALALGFGLAAVPVLVTLGVLRDSPRGAGFGAAEAASFALPPVGLLQALVAGLFGALDRPLEVWWGGSFFPGGFPYFASLYLGPLVIALAVVGLPVLPRRERFVLVGAAALAVAYALGPAGGLWMLVHDWPLVRWFRFPSKALFSAHLVAALLAGYGLDRLRAEARAWRGFGIAAGLLGLACAGLAAVPLLVAESLARWLWLDGRARTLLEAELPLEAGRTALVAWLGVLLAALALARRAAPALASKLVAAVIVLDLARAGAGLNPQAPAAFFDLLPGLSAERLETLAGGRVFPVPPLRSRSFRAWLDTRPPGLGLLAFYVDRQILDPFTNVIDGVEAAATVDRTGFVAQPPELSGADYGPAQLGRALPRLRNAAVTRVLSLDALALPDLHLRARVPVPPTPLVVRVYDVARPWPRAYVACRALIVGSRAEAAAAPYGAGFDPRADVALEAGAGPAAGDEPTCKSGSARLVSRVAGREAYTVESDGPGWLVTRDSHARGWQAAIDGRGARVLRANGRQRAVRLPGGRHEVVLRYEPPGLRAGMAVTALALVAVVLVLLRGRCHAAAP